MGLEDVVEKLEAVPEQFRTLYVEKDGKFLLDMARITDTTNLKKSLESEREAKKRIENEKRDLEKSFEGINPKTVKEMMARLDNDEEGRLMKEGKLDELVNKRTERNTERLRQDFEKKLGDKDGEIQQKAQVVTKLQRRALGSVLTTTFLDLGVHKDALEDVLLNALNEHWTVNEDGEAVMLDKDGDVVLGKDGKSPLQLTEWGESKRATKKHWWPAGNAGGGAAGSHGAKGQRDLSGLSPTDRMTAAREGKIGARR